MSVFWEGAVLAPDGFGDIWNRIVLISDVSDIRTQIVEPRTPRPKRRTGASRNDAEFEQCNEQEVRNEVQDDSARMRVDIGRGTLAWGRKILFEGKEHALQYVQPNNAIYPCSQCWRWTHQGNCKLRGVCCSRCGAMHGDDYHPISCFSCKVIKASGGTPPEVCPPEHCWCPNCKVYGHGPNDKPQCRFWKKNRNAEWIKKHAEGSEDPYQQKERELKELRKVKQATAKTADAVKAMAQANDAAFLEDIQDGMNDITASGQFVQGSSNEPTVSSCLI